MVLGGSYGLSLPLWGYLCDLKVGTRVSHFYTFFELRKIDQKFTFSERFSFLHFLQGKKGQNKPKNPQN